MVTGGPVFQFEALSGDPTRRGPYELAAAGTLGPAVVTGPATAIGRTWR